MEHIGQFIYMMTHWLYVFWECRKLGVARRAFRHDWSKFRRDEWAPYAQNFDGRGRYRPPVNPSPELQAARRLHQERNPHHWEHYVFTGRDGQMKAINIPFNARREMLADWRAAARQKGNDLPQWYKANQDKILLNPKTRQWIEKELNI